MNPWTDEDAALIRRASGVDPHLVLDGLDDDAVASLVHRHGMEMATAIVYDRVMKSPRHTGLAARLAREAPRPLGHGLVVGLVPGALYDRNAHTGADGERVLGIVRRCGFQAERIETQPFGEPEANGRLIASWIERQIEQGRRVALVTLSKGTLDACDGVRLCAPQQIGSIAGWLSLSGVWNGTALVDWLDLHVWRRLLLRGTMAISGRPYGTLETLRRTVTMPTLPRLNARVVSMVGMPLEKHLCHRWAARGYEQLSRFGPNDGGAIVLSDVRQIPGEVYPVWGMDHYFNPLWDVEPLIARLLLEALRPLEGSDEPRDHPARASAPIATSPPASKSMA